MQHVFLIFSAIIVAAAAFTVFATRFGYPRSDRVRLLAGMIAVLFELLFVGLVLFGQK